MTENENPNKLRPEIEFIWNTAHDYLDKFQTPYPLPWGGISPIDFNELYSLIYENSHNTNHIDINSINSNIKIADIGCYTGLASILFSFIVSKCGKESKVYSIDWFKGSDNSNLQDISKDFGPIQNIFIGLKNQHQFPFTSNIELIEDTSENAVKRFDNEYFDVVFVDADHRYKYFKRDVEIWLPKLKKGGLLCGHDCEITFEDGLQGLWDKFENEDHIRAFIHPGVCKLVTEIGGKKTRTSPPYSAYDMLRSVIWYYVK